MTTMPHFMAGVQSRGVCPSQVEINIDRRLECVITAGNDVGMIARVDLKPMREGVPLPDDNYDVLLLENTNKSQNSIRYMLEG